MMIVGGGHAIDWSQTAQATRMAWLDDEMGDRAGDGIDDHASQISTRAVAASDFASNDRTASLRSWMLPLALSPLVSGRTRPTTPRGVIRSAVFSATRDYTVSICCSTSRPSPRRRGRQGESVGLIARR